MLYRVCVIVAGASLVLISSVIPWGVFTRYVLNSAASWPEPMAILLIGEALVALISLFMVIWGEKLVGTTWHQSIAEFPALSVGITYLPIPISGAVTLAFVAERLLIGPPKNAAEPHRDIITAD